MRQSHCGECCESIGTVEGVVHPLAAPPPRCNYIRGGEDGKRNTKKNRVVSEISASSVLTFEAFTAGLCSAHLEMKRFEEGGGSFQLEQVSSYRGSRI